LAVENMSTADIFDNRTRNMCEGDNERKLSTSTCYHSGIWTEVPIAVKNSYINHSLFKYV